MTKTQFSSGTFQPAMLDDTGGYSNDERPPATRRRGHDLVLQKVVGIGVVDKDSGLSPKDQARWSVGMDESPHPAGY